MTSERDENNDARHVGVPEVVRGAFVGSPWGAQSKIGVATFSKPLLLMFSGAALCFEMYLATRSRSCCGVNAVKAMSRHFIHEKDRAIHEKDGTRAGVKNLITGPGHMLVPSVPSPGRPR